MKRLFLPRPFLTARVCLPLYRFSHLLGANYVVSNDGADLVVAAAGGQTGSIKTVNVNGTPMVPMDKAMSLIGGEQRWDASKRTLTLLAQLNSVEYENDTLKINCSFPVHASAKILGDKIIVDVPNTKLESEAKEVYIGAPDSVEGPARAVQRNNRAGGPRA